MCVVNDTVSGRDKLESETLGFKACPQTGALSGSFV